MYSVNVDDSKRITVSGGKHQVSYAVDGSLMNPLEAFYAVLAVSYTHLTLPTSDLV